MPRKPFLKPESTRQLSCIAAQQAAVPQTSVLLKQVPRAKHFTLLPEEEVPRSLWSRLIANPLSQALEAGTVS